MMNNNDVTELAEKAKQGSKTAFEKLYKEFYQKLYYFVKQNVSAPDAAEDITAETFCSAMEHISELHSNESFVGWLYCIAYHKCADYNKKTAADRICIDGAAELAALSEPVFLPDDYAVNTQTKQQLQAVIDSLPPDMRSVIILYYYDDLSLAELAKVIGTNKNNAAQKLHTARKKLRSKIEKLIGKGSLFSAVPLSAVLANLENAGLLSGAAATAAALGAAAAVPVTLSKLSGGTAKELTRFILKYWRRHKKSLAALLFSGVLLCALICCAMLTLRQEYIRQIDEMYNREGHYEFLTTTEHQDVIDILTGEDTVTGKMNVYGLMGVGNIKYEYGSLDDPNDLAHIPMEAGRLPQKKGEIAIDRQVLTNFGFFGKVGDEITLDKGTFTLVGIIFDDRETSENWDRSYGWSRECSRLRVDENKQGNYWIEDKSQFDKAYYIPLMFVSPDEEQTPEYTLVMIDKINGLNRAPFDYDVFDLATFDNGMDKVTDKITDETEYDIETFGRDYGGLFKDHHNDAISYYQGKFHEQIYTKFLLYGAAIIIAILSIIAVMRNIFAERENTISMLRRIGMSKRRIRVMYTIEYIVLVILQTVIGIAAGIAVHLGTYEYQVNVLEKSEFSGFSHNEYDRFLCPDPFVWSALIAAGVLLVGYVLAVCQNSKDERQARCADALQRCSATAQLQCFRLCR